MTQPPGPFRPPSQQNHVPLIAAATAAVLVVLGAATFVLLRIRDDVVTPVAHAATASGTLARTAPDAPSTNDGAFAEGAQPSRPTRPAAGGAFEGSGDVALAWVQAMADGDWQGAFDLSCPEVQDAATTAAAESDDPPYELGAYFFTHTLGGAGFTQGTLEGVEHSDAGGTDVATFALNLDTGERVPLQVYVDEGLTVCDFR